jgi:hypothetical protein
MIHQYRGGAIPEGGDAEIAALAKIPSSRYRTVLIDSSFPEAGAVWGLISAVDKFIVKQAHGNSP